MPEGVDIGQLVTASRGRREDRIELFDEIRGRKSRGELDGLAFDAGGTRGIPPTRLQAGVAMLAAGEEFVVLVIRGF